MNKKEKLNIKLDIIKKLSKTKNSEDMLKVLKEEQKLHPEIVDEKLNNQKQSN